MVLYGMGIGELGKPEVIIKRKFRYRVRFEGNFEIPAHAVKVAQRPTLEIDETEINYLNGSMSIPGKGKWQPLSITYYDIAQPSSHLIPLYNWIATVYDYTNSAQDGLNIKQSEKSGWANKGILTMYDGCGSPLEEWTLYDCWPQTVNFGELDYATSEEATIELTIKYRWAQLELMCGGTIKHDCKGCGSGAAGGGSGAGGGAGGSGAGSLGSATGPTPIIGGFPPTNPGIIYA